MKISSNSPFNHNTMQQANKGVGQVEARSEYGKATDEVMAAAERGGAAIPLPPPAAGEPSEGMRQLQLTPQQRTSQHYVYGIQRTENMALRTQTALRSYRAHAELNDEGLAELLPRLDTYI